MSGEGIRLYRTVAHPCGYFADRQSQNLVLDPESPRLPEVYGAALAHGYRRAGNIVYRPDCGACRACIPYRIPIAHFRANRAQRRVLARNRDLQMRWTTADLDHEQYALYRRYLGARHSGGGMDEASAEDQARFLLSQWAHTRLLELRLDGTLLAVAVTDIAADSASAVYTYFDPAHERRSLGTCAILQQIEFCRRAGLAHLYLGFWIDGHPKMDYKRHFGPAEVRAGDRWIALRASRSTPATPAGLSEP